MLKVDQSSMIRISLNRFTVIEESERATISNPCQRMGIRVIFTYGKDVKRRIRNSLLSFEFLRQSSWYFVSFLSVALLLYALRRKVGLHRSDFLSSFIDTEIIFFGGGNLQFNHRFERWILTIFLFGAFFLVSVWLNIYLFSSLVMVDQKIDTFEELAEIDPPIYLSMMLKGIEAIILEMLRFDLNISIRQNMYSNSIITPRNKYGTKKFHYAGLNRFRKLHGNHDLAFAFITEEFLLEFIRIEEYAREFDLLSEPLGNFNETEKENFRFLYIFSMYF